MTPDSRLQTPDFDERMMRRALELAAKGAGLVSPSPLVGCVIVDDKGEIAGEGFYVYDGLHHAEAIALAQAGERARGATAYVSLEPHAYMSRTPPCTTSLIEAGVARVVASIEDPNPLVAGSGFEHLRSAGVQVDVGLMSEEATRVNEHYVHAMKRRRPFVHLKLACSLDGRIATRTGDARWITGEEARARVHELRHGCDAILIGVGTAIKDDPLLTDRSGRKRRRPLARVVLDERLQLGTESRLARTASESPLIIFASERADEHRARELETLGAEVVRVPHGGRNLGRVLDNLFGRAIQSVLVEGGAHVAGAFLEAGLIDKVSFFIAPIIIGGSDAKSAVGGSGAITVDQAIKLRDIEIKHHGPDVEITGYPKEVTGDR